MLKIAINIAAILLVYIFQTGLISSLPQPLNFFSIPLTMIILVTYVFGLNYGLGWLIALGILLDRETNLSPGSTILSFFATIILINIFSNNIFTNRSLYSCLILCLLGTLLQTIVFSLANYNYFYVNFDLVGILTRLGWQMGLNLLLTASVFLILVKFYKGLKSYVLNK